MSTECSICCEKYKAGKRIKITCQECKESMCLQCIKNYIQTLSTPIDCMFCHSIWSNDFILLSMPKSFISKEYKIHRENLLFEREKILLPITQSEALKELEKRRIISEELRPLEEVIFERKEMIRKYKNKMKMIEKERHQIIKNYRETDDKKYVSQMSNLFPIFFKKCEKLMVKINQIKTSDEYISITNQIETIKEKLYKLNQPIQTNTHQTNPEPIQKEKKIFIKHCPINTCKGYLSSAWKCGLCNIKVCSKCHDPIIQIEGKTKKESKDLHECKNESLLTADLLRNDTKGCPKCGIGIYRISGCNQMFCTQCSTAFNWVTGKIVKGRIHNPHYFEYLRQRGVTEEELPCENDCNRIIYFNRILNFLYDYSADYNYRQEIQNLYDFAIDSHRRSMNHNQNETRVNMDLRVKLLLGDIDENKFKSLLQRRLKQHEFKQELMQIYQLFYNIFMDTCREILQTHQDFYHSYLEEECPDYLPKINETRMKFEREMIEKREEILRNYELGENENPEEVLESRKTIMTNNEIGKINDEYLGRILMAKRKILNRVKGEFSKMGDFINECLEGVAKRYGSKRKLIIKDWYAEGNNRKVYTWVEDYNFDVFN